MQEFFDTTRWRRRLDRWSRKHDAIIEMALGVVQIMAALFFVVLVVSEFLGAVVR